MEDEIINDSDLRKQNEARRAAIIREEERIEAYELGNEPDNTPDVYGREPYEHYLWREKMDKINKGLMGTYEMDGTRYRMPGK